MSERAKLPLNTTAVSKADDEFYANHPEFVQDGKRIPLDATDPAQASLRKEWMASYLANGGELEGTTPSKKKPEEPAHSCPICKEGQGQLVVTVIDNLHQPVEGATVTADGLTQKTDKQGVADFGVVDAKTYQIAASKQDYTPWGPFNPSVEVVSQEKATATLGLTNCVTHQLNKRFMIARAVDPALKPLGTVSLGKVTIPDSAGGPIDLDFGQDITHEFGRTEPSWARLAGFSEKELKDEMLVLLDDFAKHDTDGKARREFDAFLKKNSTVTIYTDPALDKAIEKSGNFISFTNRTVSAPGTPPAAGKVRIHQALASAGWDINAVALIDDLGVPAFNDGSKVTNSGDWGNGLAVMIDGVQYVLVFVDKYEYDSCRQQYTLTLIFELYDVFGLDDIDLQTYGANSDVFNTDNEKGITAWWQLQHQLDYAPMVTKSVVTRTFTVSTAP